MGTIIYNNNTNIKHKNSTKNIIQQHQLKFIFSIYFYIKYFLFYIIVFEPRMIYKIIYINSIITRLIQATPN